MRLAKSVSNTVKFRYCNIQSTRQILKMQASAVLMRLRRNALPAINFRGLSSVADNSKLGEYWMPFTHNRHFKTVESPKMFHRADG